MPADTEGLAHMTTSLLKLTDVVLRTRRSRSTIYDEVKRGVFPRQIKVGRGSYWRDDEITMILDAYSSGATDERLKALCEHIHHRRSAMKTAG